MSDKINDGGPAFPLTRESSFMKNYEGMTLRDWFAGKAMAALPHIGCGADLGYDELAADAYRFADAMIAARSKGGGK